MMQVANMSVAFEADLGVFLPQVVAFERAEHEAPLPHSIESLQGLEFTGTAAAFSIMQEIMQLASPLNASQVITGGSNVDSGPWGRPVFRSGRL
jgi:hypothetical protein